MCNYRPKSNVQSLFLCLNLIMMITRYNKHNPPTKLNLNTCPQASQRIVPLHQGKIFIY